MTDLTAPVPTPATGVDAPLVLLFYDGYERKARAGRAVALYQRGRSRARAFWRMAKGKQVNTGFYVAFVALVEGLRQLGCEVRINDFAAARARPGYPIGLAGYPSVLDQVDLPNPAIFGPGDPGYPDTAGAWAAQEKVRHVIQPSPWFVDFYRATCGDKMLCCPVGIDTDVLEDTHGRAKTVDVLIYDKIRWHRDTFVPAIRDRLVTALKARGLSHRILEYGHHTQDAFFAALREVRSMAFLCEHETQGLACEEAMAMNVPIFAWDEGVLADPLQQPFAPAGLKVSSVPYFDESCGRTFLAKTLETDLGAFWAALADYHPRDYIAAALSPRRTAMVYLDAYRALIP